MNLLLRVAVTALTVSLPLLQPAAWAVTREVQVNNSRFIPKALIINVGDTVRWINVEGLHNVASDTPGLFRSGDPALPPWTYEVTFDTPGVFPYHCEEHIVPGGNVSSTGKVIVQGEERPGALRFAEFPVPTREGDGTVTLMVERIQGADGPASVDYATRAESARAFEDFEPTTGTLHWDDQDSSPKSLTVTIVDDHLLEVNEGFFVDLVDSVGAPIAFPDTTVVVISDNDPVFEPFTCVEDDLTLCLAEDRFQVRVTFATVGGDAGDGRAVELTLDTGYFWFFNEANVEMVIKVLDACDFANRFWVFAGGLTNVEVEITVTDSQTGWVQTYRNPQETPFQPIQDTNAFGACP